MTKILRFGLIGAVGSLIGALLGEGLLWLAAPTRAEAGAEAPPAILFSKDLADRLKHENAGVGDVEIALSWNNKNDLDLHCIEPDGEEIAIDNRQSKSGGFLDVDKNDTIPYVDNPVEHIVWQPPHKPPAGTYQVVVEHRALRKKGDDPTEYHCEVVVRGDFKEQYSRSFTGSISRGERAVAGEFEIQPKPAALATAGQMAWLAGVTAAWTALLAVCLSLALVAGQNHYLRRSLLPPNQAAVALLGGAVAGGLAGGAGQALFGLVRYVPGASGLLSDEVLDELGRFVGWLLLGGLLGRGMAFFIPNLRPWRAAVAGALGGLAAAWAFVDVTRAMAALAEQGRFDHRLSDAVGHVAGGALLGLFLGLMIALVEAAFRQAWLEVVFGPKEVRTIALGSSPVSIGGGPGCTVYANGTAPVALRYRFENGTVLCEDVAAGRTESVRSGDVRRAGRLTLYVRGKGAAGGAPAAGSAAPGRFSLRLADGRTLGLPDGARLTSADLPGLDGAGSAVVAEVTRNPQNPDVRGLKNASRRVWWATVTTGEKRRVDPGRNLLMAHGTRIDFGPLAGELEAVPSRGRAVAPGRAVLTAAAAAALLLFAGLFAVDWVRRHPAGAAPPDVSPGPAVAGPERSPAERAVCKGHTDRINSVAFSPRGDLFASGSSDATVRLWKAADGSAGPVLKGHQAGVFAVAFDPDGRLLASASGDGTVRLWRVADGGTERTLPNALCACLAFSPDGQVLLGGGPQGFVHVWRVADGEPLGLWVAHGEMVQTVRFSKDGKAVVTGGWDKVVRLWDVSGRDWENPARTPLTDITGLPGGVHTAALSRDGDYLTAGCCMGSNLDEKTAVLKPGVPDDFFRLFSADGGRKVRTLTGHSSCVTSAAFSPVDDSLMASGSSDKTIKLWRVPEGECLDTLEGHTKEIWSIAFSPDGKLLASGGNDWTVRLWNLPAHAGRR